MRLMLGQPRDFRANMACQRVVDRIVYGSASAGRSLAAASPR